MNMTEFMFYVLMRSATVTSLKVMLLYIFTIHALVSYFYYEILKLMIKFRKGVQVD